MIHENLIGGVAMQKRVRPKKRPVRPIPLSVERVILPNFRIQNMSEIMSNFIEDVKKVLIIQMVFCIV